MTNNKSIFKKIKKGQVISTAVISSIAIAFVIVLIGMSYYKYKIMGMGNADSTDYNSYKYHYVMISEAADDDPFWESVYLGAVERGKEQDVFVEKIGNNLSVSYTIDELMQIAIASKVDGIIIEPNGEESVAELINEAEEAGITVVTVLEDAVKSNRKSFIGVNSYNQGQAYGKQVLDVIGNNRSNVTVILNSGSKDESQNNIYTTIRETVNNVNVELNTAIVNTQSVFSSEEDMRDIIMDKVNPPDVLVCLTADDTISASRAVVDYNKVGLIEIIGYYDSELILSAIEKDIIHSTIAINAEQMGNYCVDAITEYRETNRVSAYLPVDITLITSENIDEYINTRNEDIKARNDDIVQ